jgi:hypothetical protein
VQYGLNGAALAWVLAYPLLFLIIVRLSLPVLGFGYKRYLLAWIRPMMASTVMYLVIIGLREQLSGSFGALPTLLLLMAVGVIIYVTCIIILDRRTSFEFIRTAV